MTHCKGDMSCWMSTCLLTGGERSRYFTLQEELMLHPGVVGFEPQLRLFITTSHWGRPWEEAQTFVPAFPSQIPVPGFALACPYLYVYWGERTRWEISLSVCLSGYLPLYLSNRVSKWIQKMFFNNEEHENGCQGTSRSLPPGLWNLTFVLPGLPQALDICTRLVDIWCTAGWRQSWKVSSSLK